MPHSCHSHRNRFIVCRYMGFMLFYVLFTAGTVCFYVDVLYLHACYLPIVMGFNIPCWYLPRREISETKFPGYQCYRINDFTQQNRLIKSGKWTNKIFIYMPVNCSHFTALVLFYNMLLIPFVFSYKVEFVELYSAIWRWSMFFLP